MTGMQRARLPNGDTILIRRICGIPAGHPALAGQTIALISHKRRYGVYSLTNKKWVAGPYPKLKPATAAYESIIFEPVIFSMTLDDDLGGF